MGHVASDVRNVNIWNYPLDVNPRS
jgi:hypothetical protein